MSNPKKSFGRWLCAITMVLAGGSAPGVVLGYSAGQQLRVRYHGDVVTGTLIRQDASGLYIKFRSPYLATAEFEQYFPLDAVVTHSGGETAAVGNSGGETNRRSGGNTAAQSPVSQATGPAELRPGTYVVRTYSAGINYRPGPVTWYFKVLPGNRYSAQGTTGSFAVSGGTVRWSGGMHGNGDWLNPSPVRMQSGVARIVFKKSPGGRDTVIGSGPN
jgi:hypothetical protein